MEISEPGFRVCDFKKVVPRSRFRNWFYVAGSSKEWCLLWDRTGGFGIGADYGLALHMDLQDFGLSRLEDGMAHTFVSCVGVLSGLVSGGFRRIGGWNLPVSGLESSQGSYQCPEGLVAVMRIAWLDS